MVRNTGLQSIKSGPRKVPQTQVSTMIAIGQRGGCWVAMNGTKYRPSEH